MADIGGIQPSKPVQPVPATRIENRQQPDGRKKRKPTDEGDEAKEEHAVESERVDEVEEDGKPRSHIDVTV